MTLNKMNTLKLFLVMALCQIVACTNPLGDGASKVDEGHHPGDVGTGGGNQINKTQPGRGSEIVSSSRQNVLTSGGRFRVQGSLGELTHQVQSESLTRHYKVFSNIQGEFVAGDLAQ